MYTVCVCFGLLWISPKYRFTNSPQICSLSFRVPLLPLGQSHDCPNDSKGTLRYIKDIGQIFWYLTTTKENYYEPCAWFVGCCVSAVWIIVISHTIEGCKYPWPKYILFAQSFHISAKEYFRDAFYIKMCKGPAVTICHRRWQTFPAWLCIQNFKAAHGSMMPNLCKPSHVLAPYLAYQLKNKSNVVLHLKHVDSKEGIKNTKSRNYALMLTLYFSLFNFLRGVWSI